MGRISSPFIFFILALTASNAHAAPPAALIHQQAQNQTLQDIGWRLAQGNARFCNKVQQSTGLQLQDMRSYKAPDTVRQVLGLNGDFAVASIARGSPAQGAGLMTNQEVLAVAGQRLDVWPAAKQLDWKRQARAQDAIDRALERNGSVAITLAAGQTVELRGTTICATRFDLAGKGDHAVAEGRRIIVGADFPGFGYLEDEFAAAIAHEAAHDWLDHQTWLNAHGRKQKHIRLTEREADRLMPWLLANAGYDPAAALRFMKRWGPHHDGGVFRKRTHDGWDERAQAIAEEMEIVSKRMAASGSADWRNFFRRNVAIAPPDQSRVVE